MDMVYELQRVRAELVSQVDATFEQLLQRVRAEQEGLENAAAGETETTGYEAIYPLSVGPAIFKGKKPTGVIFANGARIDVPSWKKVVEEILRRCNAEQDKHLALMELRGKVAGRERTLLAKNGNGMRSPMKIDRNLYMETHYDTQTLLRILTLRILDVVGYDHSGIAIAIRSE